MSPRSRLALSLLWLALLVVLGWSVSQRLEMSGDLRKFMPAQNINSRATKHDAARAACVGQVPSHRFFLAMQVLL